jgi:N-acetyl-gamma-glutamyl-phosphate reductase common form
LTIPVAILGGSGYVAGELLRLLAFHPVFVPQAVVSESQAGAKVGKVFPHLAGVWPQLELCARPALAELFASSPEAALFSAAPHGASAPLLAAALALAEEKGCAVHAVDLSADFRFADPAAYAAAYGHPHPAPELQRSFHAGLPEHAEGTPARHVGHPGCFVTSVLLPVVALLRLGIAEPYFSVTALTGSTGAGRSPGPKTHHPERRSNVAAYSPLGHRHQPEMETLAAAASGTLPEIFFVPQSGPQARGIYTTIHTRLLRPLAAGEVRAALRDFYAGAPFVTVMEEPPRLQEVVGTNDCHLGAAVKGEQLVVFAALDNLVKGAAGGGMQWMNRLFGLADDKGLRLPGLGWL